MHTDLFSYPYHRDVSVGVLGTGVPSLPACGPGLAHYIITRLARSSPTSNQALVRAQASRGGGASGPAGDLLRTPPEQRIFRGRARPQKSRVTPGKDRRAADGRTGQFPLWGKGGGGVQVSQRHLPKVSLPVQQSRSLPPVGQTSSTSPSLWRRQLLCRRRPPLGWGACSPVPLQNWPLWDPLLPKL